MKKERVSTTLTQDSPETATIKTADSSGQVSGRERIGGWGWEKARDTCSSLSQEVAAWAGAHAHTLSPGLQSKHKWTGNLSLASCLDGQWRTAFLTFAEKESSQKKGVLRKGKTPHHSIHPFWSKVF